MSDKLTILSVLHHPRKLSAHSGMDALADALGAYKVYYRITWELVQERSWRLGQWLREFGNAYYGSEWNALIPYWDEWRIRKKIRACSPSIVHFLWAEFARPKSAASYHQRGARLVGTFHASARKQPLVLRSPEVFHVFDFVTLMSESQKPFVLSKGYPESRVHIILHGVDTDFFQPGPDERGADGEPLRALLVGKTERDHEFTAELMRKLPRDVMDLEICTSPEHVALYYKDVPNIRILPWLSDEALRDAYQRADLLFMPLHDCGANNAVLEAMACGTPVMANRVGGIPEYVPDEAGILMDNKSVDDWIEALRSYVHRRTELRKRGRRARRRVEELSWRKIAGEYEQVFLKLESLAR